MSGRPQHHDLGAERTVLSCALLDGSCLDLVELSAEDFYAQQHAIVWQAMHRIHAATRPVDLTTLRAELLRAGELDRAGGDEALMALSDSIPIVERVEQYARIVRSHATIRRTIAVGLEIQARAAEPIESAEQFLDEAEAALLALSSNRRDEAGEQSLKDVVIETLDDLSKRSDAGGITGLRTGFSGLDSALGGLEPGQLVIVAGRPGSGKSAFAQAIIAHAASEGARVGVWSLEMSGIEWGRRLLMARASVRGALAKIGRLDPIDWTRLTQAGGDLANLPVRISTSPGLTGLQLRARARRMQARHGLDLVVVDYLQLMRWHEKTESREREVEKLSGALKHLAIELGVPVIALAQLNREPERRAAHDKRPQVADLRNSGAIEQDADVILLLYRDAMYYPDKADPRAAEIIIGKQRSGATATVKASWRAEYTRFEDADPGGFVDDQRQLPGEFADPGTDYSSRRVGSP